MSEYFSTPLLEGIPSDTLSKVLEHLKGFCLSQEKLQEVSDLLEKDLVRGLGKHSHDEAPVKMLPAFVRATPDGTETGDYLGLDLGGTKLRVLHVRMPGGVLMGEMDVKEVPEAVKKSGEKLFDHIAERLDAFLIARELKGQKLPLGFSFSFSFKQEKIDEGIVLSWAKDFDCHEVVNKDVVTLLKDAIERKKYEIGPVIVVNDAVGTMMSCESCDIGMIVGTGTNACYMEEMKNVERLEGEDGQMCINTEWGAFGDDGCLKDIQTEFDLMVDEKCSNPLRRKDAKRFEKMISGKYLGEIVRLVLVKLAEKKLLFKGQKIDTLGTRDIFESKFISDIEQEKDGLSNAETKLKELGLKCDSVDCRVVRLVCDTISSRSAHLCAAALATIANRMRVNRKLDHLKTTVGVDGAVYLYHPNFSKKLKKMVCHLAPQCDITFRASRDGSGKGAAMAMAVVQRQALKK